MRLVNAFQLSAWERQHAYCGEEAVARVCQALHDHHPIEGLEALRSGLMIDVGSEVLDAIEGGEWWLVSAEADYGDWAVAQRTFDSQIMNLMKNPPAQPSRSPRIFRLVDSVTGEPLAQRRYIATMDGQNLQRTTDGEGIAHLFGADESHQLSVEVIGAGKTMDT